VQARFLLGPAGSGKTFQCLAEVRAALRAAPDGPPLILLAPKQATFQIERQLLADGEISGFTRLHIFSFDKLARFVLEQLHVAPPKMLSSEGRVMVLRALLMRHEQELNLFGRSARRPGFAAELSSLLSELQQHQFTPAKLRLLAEAKKLRPELQNKLRDLALILEHYAGWLTEHDLQDTDCLLDFATGVMRDEFKIKNSKLKIESLWLDGFAEMTPQELDFLAVFLPWCQRATLAFCLESQSDERPSRLSIWSAIRQTFDQCCARLKNLPGTTIKIETLERDPQKNRFAGNATLQALEQNWARQISGSSSTFDLPSSSLRLVACENPEAEAVFAAREILKFVRAGNRFRDCALLVRTLTAHHKPLARIFRRYEIPFFLDRREAVTHHPLAELTRSALRTVAFDWQPDDLFAALKAGFSSVAETEIDRLENAALEFGWRGKKWREPLPDAALERIRTEVVPPFESFSINLGGSRAQPTGEQLAAAIRDLWNDLAVEPTLGTWDVAESESAAHASRPASLHATVREQMSAWLDNVALAFPREPMMLRDWLPILEAGLAGLTVGVIPPALDQVLVGAIDRARNPDLKFTLVLGVNESVFPATPATPAILTNADRVELEAQNAALGANVFDQISRERYLGYIACTRAGEKLAVTFFRQSAEGKTLNPSPFIAQLQKIFPVLTVEEYVASHDCRTAEHASELTGNLVDWATPHPGPLPSEGRGGNAPSPRINLTLSAAEQTSELREANNGCSLSHPMGEGQGEGDSSSLNRLLVIPALKSLTDKLAELREPDGREKLSSEVVAKIYGTTLRSSVSRLEEFASCPFKFFVRIGLRAGERKVFELDARERGNFQHDVLKIFHEQLQAEGKRWRDLTPVEARKRIGDIAAVQMEGFRDGLLRDSAESVFAARAMAAALQDFIEVIVTWMREQYDFDPAQVELGFGGKTDSTPAWEIELGDGHKLALQGRIDRVDLWREPGSDTALAVVTDYKSAGKKLESLLVENGVQLQLLAYLGALRQWQNPQEVFGAGKIIPAGAFYVSLQGKFDGGDTRDEILGDAEAKKLAYRHNGRFDASVLRLLDRRPGVESGDQFSFRLKQDGTPYKTSKEVLSSAEFEKLIEMVEGQLRALGGRIFSGAAAVDPYRKGKQTPCEYCDYRAACRLDEWTHEWRVLRAEKTEATT